MPKNIAVTVNRSVSMNYDTMMKWIEICFKTRGNYFANIPSLLFMDSYGVQRSSRLSFLFLRLIFGIYKKISQVCDFLQRECTTTSVFIPPKMTIFFNHLMFL